MKKPLDIEKLTRDLNDAYEAAIAAAAAVTDGGSCCMDDTRLFGVAYTEEVRVACAAAGLNASVTSWLGSPCIALSTDAPGQAGKRHAAAEALTTCLRSRGWDATTFYQMD